MVCAYGAKQEQIQGQGGDTGVADGVLLVEREGTIEKRGLEHGLQALEGSKLLGVVLNSCTPSGHSNYYQRYGAPAIQSQV